MSYIVVINITTNIILAQETGEATSTTAGRILPSVTVVLRMIASHGQTAARMMMIIL